MKYKGLHPNGINEVSQSVVAIYAGGEPIGLFSTGSTTFNTSLTASFFNGTLVGTGSGSFSGSFQGDGSQLTGVAVEVSEVATVKANFTNTTSTVVNHNFDSKNVIVSVYDNNDKQIIPQSITLTDSNSTTVTFSSPESGFVVVAKGGHVVSGSIQDVSSAIINSSPNKVLTDNGDGTITAESNFTFNGSTSSLTGSLSISGSLEVSGGASGSFSGSFQGDGSGLTNLPVASTPDPLTVNRLCVGSGHGATLGTCATIAGGCINTASNNFTTVGGGLNNTASGAYSTIGGGDASEASGNCSTVGGGRFNAACDRYTTVSGGYRGTASCWYSTVSGGYTNTASNRYSTVGGGKLNTANGLCSTVGGGQSNTASGGVSTVSGGRSNTACAGYATVGGGYLNTANGNYSGILGGTSNHTCGFASSFIIGSNICATAACTTFMNNLNVAGNVNATCFIGDGSGLTGVVSSSYAVTASYALNGGGGGSALTVTDNTTTVNDVDKITFSGATVTNDGNGDTTITISGGGGTADLSEVAEDILPLFDEVFDIGSVDKKWYDGYFTNKVQIGDTGSISVDTDGDFIVNTNTVVQGTVSGETGDFGDILISGSTITAQDILGEYGGQRTLTLGNTTNISGNVDITGEILQNGVPYPSQKGTGIDSVVANKHLNIASGEGATVSGGGSTYKIDPQSPSSGKFNIGTNTASGNYSTIGGGTANTTSCYWSTVGGGGGNTACGNSTTVGGGRCNTACANYSTVSGGRSNTASGIDSTVSGGLLNTACRNRSTVSGGSYNTASGYSSTVSGGYRNTASNSYSTAGGGCCNTASGYISTVSGGRNNTASGYSSTVSGGRSNTASGIDSTVSGGFANNASGNYSGILGGRFNNTCGYADSFIIGSNICATASCTTFVNNFCVLGTHNITASPPDPLTVNRLCVGSGHGAILGTCATIAGGCCNTASSTYSTVSGGRNNTASATSSTVSGGFGNTASGFCSTVSGGYGNTASATYSTVSGGYGNTASGYSSTVSGGYGNTASGIYSWAGGRTARATGACSFAWGAGTIVGSSNVFCINNTGCVYADGGYCATAGGDYAEFFPNHVSGTPLCNGRFVSLCCGETVGHSTSCSSILGVVSTNAAIVGDAYDLRWKGMYMTDKWGNLLWEEVTETIREAVVDEEGNEIEPAVTRTYMEKVLNPDFDPNTPYVPRNERRNEWTPVGLLGKLLVEIGEGQVIQPGDKVISDDEGKAIKTEVGGYPVLTVDTENNIVKILFK